MTAAETYGDADLLILAHLHALTAYCWLGDLMESRGHADRVLALYSEERHGHLVGILNTVPKTNDLVFSSYLTWMLGYPEQALKILDAAHDYARQVGHPFALGWALTTGAEVFDYLREPDEWLKRIEEADRVGRENSLPFLTECLVPICSGIALIRKGQTAEGMTVLERGLAVWEEGGGRTHSPYYKSVQVEGLAQMSDIAGALDLLDEIVAQVERPGWEERCHYAEILRGIGTDRAQRRSHSPASEVALRQGWADGTLAGL
jgi:hypothetical protein